VVIGAFTLPQQNFHGRIVVNHLGGYYPPVGFASSAKRLKPSMLLGCFYPSFRRIKSLLLRRFLSVENREVIPHYFLCYVRVGGTVARAVLGDEVRTALLTARD
jgi:hypothetical protein